MYKDYVLYSLYNQRKEKSQETKIHHNNNYQLTITMYNTLTEALVVGISTDCFTSGYMH